MRSHQSPRLGEHTKIEDNMIVAIPFTKWTVYGNNFVIIDETAHEVIPEIQKGSFSRLIAQREFGIGCDDVLFIQCMTGEQNPNIADTQVVSDATWRTSPLSMRVFEPDGTEAAMCGNGLIAASAHMCRMYGERIWSFATEIPTRHVRARMSKVVPSSHYYFAVDVSMCHVATIEDAFFSRSGLKAVSRIEVGDDSFECIDCLEILDAHSLYSPRKERLDDSELALNTHCDVYAISCGEPHLIFFVKAHASASSLVSGLFSKDDPQKRGDVLARIGNRLNNARSTFPYGINISIAQVNQTTGYLEMRSFERGLLRETFACGTGAIAVSAIAAHARSFAQDRPMHIAPLLASTRTLARYVTVHERDGWHLKGDARLLFQGEYWYSTDDLGTSAT